MMKKKIDGLGIYDWPSDIDDEAVEFDIGEAITNDNMFTARFSRECDDETVSDDLDSLPQDLDGIDHTLNQDFAVFIAKLAHEHENCTWFLKIHSVGTRHVPSFA